ncbi:heme-binding protein, partial [Pontibacterium sp.]|uniref:GlcG/HbpS family heme-binding protein n=1 Tax=Pontibacterium sp. TaxID=2036026 RepID=UPI003569CC9C
TGDFGKLIREASLTGIELSNGLLTGFPGGLPIQQDGLVLGALGISGGSAEQDLEIAKHALDKAGL